MVITAFTGFPWFVVVARLRFPAMNRLIVIVFATVFFFGIFTHQICDQISLFHFLVPLQSESFRDFTQFDHFLGLQSLLVQCFPHIM